MEREPHAPSAGDLTSELGGWLTAGGTLTVMLFPVSIPILALTVVALLPLLAPLLLLAVVLAPALVVRAAARAVRRRAA